jgi:hypothetical protein
MDKFLALCRYFLNDSFSFCARKSWSEDAIISVVETLSPGATHYLLDKHNQLEKRKVESDEDEDSIDESESDVEDSDEDMESPSPRNAGPAPRPANIVRNFYFKLNFCFMER